MLTIISNGLPIGLLLLSKSCWFLVHSQTAWSKTATKCGLRILVSHFSVWLFSMNLGVLKQQTELLCCQAETTETQQKRAGGSALTAKLCKAEQRMVGDSVSLSAVPIFRRCLTQFLHSSTSLNNSVQDQIFVQDIILATEKVLKAKSVKLSRRQCSIARNKVLLSSHLKGKF